LEDAIKSPTQVLLRRLLVHGNNLKHTAPRPDWTLKVLAAHTSACSLPEPSLAKDVHTALAHIRETDICESLLNAAQRDSAVAVAASSVQQLAAGAPSWVPFPAAIASEYLTYFSKPSTLDLTAAAAALLRQQQQHRKKEEESVVKRTAAEPASAAMRAELLAMALCLPLPQPKFPQKYVQKDAAILPQARGESAGEESAKRKLTERLPQDPLALELCSLLRSTPSLAISLPSPLLARACRSSYPLSIEYAAALEKLREENTVASTAVISALKQACLFDDTTTLVFKDALNAMYRSI
jgi:hypothetical protein